VERSETRVRPPQPNNKAAIMSAQPGITPASAASTRRHAVITGGSSGIGLAIAGRLVRDGWNVTLIARDAARLAKAAEDLAPHRVTGDQQILCLSADVAQRPAVDAAISRAVARLGAPDLLVTSAGICEPGGAVDLPAEVHERTMQTNYLGSLYAVLACLPAMRANGRGRIVLMSSGAGLIGIAGYAAYSPTKFALRGLAEVLRSELKPHGIGVTIVYPPDTDTPQLTYEKARRPPETHLIAGMAPTWPADRMAEAILHGVERGRSAIAPGFQMRMLLAFGDVLKPGLFWHFDRLITKARAEKAPRTPNA
jgi:3-dehydrosphinganine reductase